MSAAFTPRATRELDNLLARLTTASPQSAQKFAAAVRRAADLIGANPLIGTEYPTSNPRLTEVRYLVVGGFRNYVILYTPTPDGALILHIVHGRRDLDAILAAD